jgi:hypothetical protein
MPASLKHIYAALKEGKAIAVNNRGEWSEIGFFGRKFRALFCGAEYSWVKLAAVFSEWLDSLEETPVLFSDKEKQATDFIGYLQCAELIAVKLSSFCTPVSEAALGNLKRRTIALKYRLESVHGGADPQTDRFEELHGELLKVIEEWKLNDPMQEEKLMTERDLLRIKEACRYPLFAEVIFAHKMVRDQFIKWAFRDGNAVRPFVEFPAFLDRLVESQLNGRISRKGGEDLRVEKESVGDSSWRKILTLPMEGRRENLLDLNRRIVFRGGYVLSIKEILQVFKNKTYRVGNLEYMQDGIINWNVHHLGWWNAEFHRYERVDLTHKNWWEQLPFFEILTLNEMKARYGSYVDGVMWIAAARASRGSPTLDFEQTHAFLEVAIPMHKGHYALFDFGKFAYVFPSSFFENLTFFCRNVHATIAFPDENIFYTHRQQTQYPFTLTPVQGVQLMDAIKVDIMKARQKNFVFQIESENCAKWTYEKLESALGKGSLPNLFRMSLLDTEPIGFVGFVFSLIKKLPSFFRVPILTALHLPFGASERTWIIEEGTLACKSLTSHHFWKTAEVYLPALLHKQVKNGFSTSRPSLQFDGQVPFFPISGYRSNQFVPETVEQLVHSFHGIIPFKHEIERRRGSKFAMFL